MIFNKNLKEKGITLVALVVTIIVLLILAGVTINTALGNDGLISKARQVAVAYNNAELKEQKDLDTFGKKIDHLLSKDSVKESIIYDNQLYMLKNNGDLVYSGAIEAPTRTAYVQYDSDNETVMARNVKETFDRISFYLTNDNKLYSIDGDLLHSDIKKYVPGCLYLKTNNEIYTLDNTKIIDNAKDIFMDYYYINENNELYRTYIDHRQEYVASNITNVWAWDSSYYYYMNSNNELFRRNGTKIGDVPDGIKDFICFYTEDKIYYITNNDELYRLDGTKIANNVKEVQWSMYLTTDGKIYSFDGTEIDNNVKDISRIGYLKNNGTLHLFNYDFDENSTDEINDVIELDDYYYMDNDYNIYYQYTIDEPDYPDPNLDPDPDPEDDTLN